MKAATINGRHRHTWMPAYSARSHNAARSGAPPDRLLNCAPRPVGYNRGMLSGRDIARLRAKRHAERREVQTLRKRNAVHLRLNEAAALAQAADSRAATADSIPQLRKRGGEQHI
jgi:hypothetical protein